MNFDIKNAGVNALADAIKETGILPSIEPKADEGYVRLHFEDEHDYAIMKVRLCLYLWNN